METFKIENGETVLIGSAKRTLSGGKEASIVIKGIPEGSLAPTALAIGVNKDGNVRVRRLSRKNEVSVWGENKQRGHEWALWHLVETLPDKVYSLIDSGSVVVDIKLNDPLRQMLRLNDAERATDSRTFRVELNPKNPRLDRDS